MNVMEMTSMLVDALDGLRRGGHLVEPPGNFLAHDADEIAGDTTYLVAGEPLNALPIIAPGKALGNLVVRSSGSSTQGSRIFVQGSSNVIVIGRDAKMHNADIRVPGSNCLFYFGAFSVSVQLLCFLCGSDRQVLIGDHSIISENVWITNSDMHSIYDCDTGLRINGPGDVRLGERCWLGRDVTVLKGAVLESSVIIGTKSLVASGRFEKDSIYGGVPARKIRSNVKWSLEESESLGELAQSPSWLARQAQVRLYESQGDW